MTLKAGLFRKTPVSEPALGSSDSVVAAQIMSTVGIAGDAPGLSKVDTHVENKEVRFAVLRKKLPPYSFEFSQNADVHHAQIVPKCIVIVEG